LRARLAVIRGNQAWILVASGGEKYRRQGKQWQLSKSEYPGHFTLQLNGEYPGEPWQDSSLLTSCRPLSDLPAEAREGHLLRSRSFKRARLYRLRKNSNLT
jgi:hypothetical protein